MPDGIKEVTMMLALLVRSPGIETNSARSMTCSCLYIPF